MPIVASAYGKPSAIATSFYRSLHQLCQHYGVSVEVRTGEFPEVIHAITSELFQLLEKHHRVEAMIVSDEGQCCLATVKVLSTDQTLFYLPVRPVWNLCQVAAGSALSDLLLTLYSFFYHAHSIPYFTEPGYVDRQYDILENWAHENEDDEDREWQLDALEDLRNRGNKVFDLICQPFEIRDLYQSLDKYKRSPNPDPTIVTIAQEALNISEVHPGRNLVADIKIDIRAPDEQYRVYPDQYISFYWSGRDEFYDTFIEMISSELQEYGMMEEPAHYTLFNGSKVRTADFNFEKRMFSLICDLSEFLDPYDHEEYHPRTGGDLPPLEGSVVLQG